MDNNLFTPIKAGVCSYFLILYSCMQLSENLWYSPAGDSLTAYLNIFAAPLLMLLGGLWLAKYNKKKAAAVSEDEKPFLSAAVKFIGGWAILAMVLKYIVTFYLFRMFSGPADLTATLFPLLFYGPFLIIAAVTVRKGSVIKERPSFSAGISFLCIRIVPVFICALSLRQILLWAGPFILFDPQEHNPVLMYWIIMEFAFIAVCLILYFAPLQFKLNLKTMDGEGYAMLSRRSFTLAGYIILIAGIPYIFDAVIREYSSFFFFFFDLKKYLVQLLPSVFLILAGLLLLYFGKNMKRTESQ